MAGVLITGDAVAGNIYSSSTTYAAARSGESPAVVGLGGYKLGQRTGYVVHQLLLGFPLTGLDNRILSDVGLNLLAGEALDTFTAFTAEAYPYDWGSTTDVGDFVSGAKLASLTRYGTLASSAFPGLAAGMGGSYVRMPYPTAGRPGLVVLRWAGGCAVYETAGTYSWTCPTGVTAVNVQATGGGGGAHGTSTGYPGGGGAFAESDMTVTSGQSYTVVVGAGGAPSAGTAQDGQDSTFAATSVVAAHGHGATAYGPGAAGLAADCTGTTKISGSGVLPGKKTTGVRGLPFTLDAAMFSALQYPATRPATLRLVLASSRQRLNSAPTGEEYLDKVYSDSFQLVVNFSGNYQITGTATRRLVPAGSSDSMAFNATRALKASGRIRAALPPVRAGSVRVYDFNRRFMGVLPGTVRVSRKLDGADELNLLIPWEYAKHAAEAEMPPPAGERMLASAEDFGAACKVASVAGSSPSEAEADGSVSGMQAEAKGGTQLVATRSATPAAAWRA